MEEPTLNMIPAGWMFKKIAIRPEWLKTNGVKDIYSVSGCISEDFADFFYLWKHNGFWFFNTPEIMVQIANELAIELADLKLFYYEVYDKEFNEIENKWQHFSPEESFVTNVQIPKSKKLEGFDVASFWAGTTPEHSPLSCNSLAEEISVNEHCLFNSFDEAKTHLEAGKFENSERGPMRVFAVYSSAE